MSSQRVKFYQTGTFTVGNRLLNESDRTVQARMDRTNSLNSGHRACQGCGEALGARYALDAVMRATRRQMVAVNATGCLEVFSSPYPESAWEIPWLHSLFGNAPAVASGVAAACGPKAKQISGLSHRVGMARRLISGSGVCPVCSNAMTMSCMSVMTMRPT